VTQFRQPAQPLQCSEALSEAHRQQPLPTRQCGACAPTGQQNHPQALCRVWLQRAAAAVANLISNGGCHQGLKTSNSVHLVPPVSLPVPWQAWGNRATVEGSVRW